MAQKQTNPFKTISQKFNGNEFYTEISKAGDDELLTLHFDGNYFVVNRPILGTNSSSPAGNELVIRNAVPAIIAQQVTYQGTPGISGTVVGNIIVNGYPYPIVCPTSGGSNVAISDTLPNGVKIGTITIDSESTDINAPKPNWDANETDNDGILNRTHYSYFSGTESQSGVMSIWSMTADGTEYYYGYKTNYLYGYPVEVGKYYRVTDSNQSISDFTSQAIQCTANRSFITNPIQGTCVGNPNLLNSSLNDNGQDIAILFYNWNGARCDALVVGKYVNGNSYSLTLYEKQMVYVPLNINYIPEGIQRENTTSSSSLNIVPGKFNNLGTVDFNDIVYSSQYENSIIYGQFTSSASGTMTTSIDGDTTYWRGDTSITAGNTYQFFILNGFGKIEQIMGV